MPGQSEKNLALCLEDGRGRMGEIAILPAGPGLFLLCHRDDVGRAGLRQESGPEAAASLARLDDEGKFRPLKTAPNLAHGWQLQVRGLSELALALDYFYPGRLAAFDSFTAGRLKPTSLRETLERQTGMYRVAARISDEAANTLVARICRSEGGCLRTILWPRDRAGTPASSLLPAQKYDPLHDQTGRDETCLPLLCQEACALLVAAARTTVKETK